MKKCLFIAILLCAGVFFLENYAFAEHINTIKIGADSSGRHKVSIAGISGTEDVDPGVSISGEFVDYDSSGIGKKVGLGAGATFQFPRAQERFAGDFYFIPIYALVKARTSSKDISPFFIGHFGFNLFFGDHSYKGTGSLKPGMYYGIGAGVMLNKGPQIELLHSVNNGSYDFAGLDFDIKYTKTTLSIGWNY